MVGFSKLLLLLLLLLDSVCLFFTNPFSITYSHARVRGLSAPPSRNLLH